ncbi:MAG: endonuclease Q family protein, partial [Planctomycetota bacterium]|nr:endonuclease Q family protein [Planctomycetota bacterium]MDI6787868.1 endonuclease Q family protein [Planctomycetota bacterium]
MKFIADFHVHSKYSRATSRDMDVENLARWAEIKGINVISTGDFTHPNYFAELRLRLKPAEDGLYRLKKGNSITRFILTTETSHMFSIKGRSYRVHIIIFAPDIETVTKINTKLSRIGNISSDGRPILGLPAKEMVKLLLDISPKCFIVPAHAWTPWFSVFGSASGFDSLEECFEEETKNIYCIETGLSSDPPMNWRLSALDKITLISNSDAHSPRKIGREANVFDCDLSYTEIINTLKTKDVTKLLYTIEFFPAEGKYHYDGHRACNIIFSPSESKKHNNICTVCKKKLTIGVCHRVEDLSDRAEGLLPPGAIPNKYLIPLEEIIAEALSVGVATQKVADEYKKLIARGKNEFHILLDMPIEEIKVIAPPRIAEGIQLMREKKLNIIPGYDGVFGKVAIFNKPSYDKSDDKNSTDNTKDVFPVQTIRETPLSSYKATAP